MRRLQTLLIGILSLTFYQAQAQTSVTWTELLNMQVLTTNGHLQKTASTSSKSGATSLEVLPADQDGYFEFTLTSDAEKILGVSHENYMNGVESIDYYMLVSGSVIIIYKQNTSTPLFTLNSALNPSSMNPMKYRIERSGDSLNFYYQEPNSTAVLMHTLIEPAIGDLKADVSIFYQWNKIDSCVISVAPTVVPQGPWNAGIPNTSVPTTRVGPVGIGVGTGSGQFPVNPNTKLHVLSPYNSAGSVLFEGSHGITPTSGTGTRLMWVPEKAAFRAGFISGTPGNQWDADSIGFASFAGGENNKAKGTNSMAMGFSNSATGNSSSSLGRNNVSSGNYSLTGGEDCKATNFNSFAFGSSCRSIGKASVTFGNDNETEGEHSFTIGNGNRNELLSSFVGGSGCENFDLSGFGQDNNSFVFGSNSKTYGSNSVSIGTNVESQSESFAMGKFVKSNGNSSFTIGSGEWIPALSAWNYLENNIDNSLAIGFGSNVPTIFVEENVKPNNLDYWGKVGIGTTTPRAFLDVINPYQGTESRNGDWTAIFDATQGCYENTLIRMGDNCPTKTALGVDMLFSGGGGARVATIYGDGNGVFNTFWAFSDKKFKSKINPIQNSLEVINKLEGKTYEMRITPDSEPIQSYGFIAQDVKKIVPELAKKFHSGNYAVNYDGFIPILTEAIKEQQKQIESKDKQIQNLQNALKDLTKTVDQIKNDINTICDKGCAGLGNASGNNPTGTTAEMPSYLLTAWLGQNYPNPHSGRTSIRYFVPRDAKTAVLKVVDLQGKVISTRSLDITAANVELQDANLANGLYLYSLIVDNILIDSKRMAVEK